MTPGGFHLLFYRDLVVCVYVLAPAAEFFCTDVCLRHVANITPYLKMCFQMCCRCAFCLIPGVSPAVWLPCLAESNTMSHLLNVIVQNQRISHAFPFFPPLCLCIDSLYHPATACVAGCCDVSVMVRYWMNRGEMRSSVVNLQDHSKCFGKRGRAEQANNPGALVCVCVRHQR